MVGGEGMRVWLSGLWNRFTKNFIPLVVSHRIHHVVTKLIRQVRTVHPRITKLSFSHVPTDLCLTTRLTLAVLSISLSLAVNPPSPNAFTAPSLTAPSPGFLPKTSPTTPTTNAPNLANPTSLPLLATTAVAPLLPPLLPLTNPLTTPSHSPPLLTLNRSTSLATPSTTLATATLPFPSRISPAVPKAPRLKTSRASSAL